MKTFTVGITWQEIVEHYGEVVVEAEDEEAAKNEASRLNDIGEVEFKEMDGEVYGGPDYEIMTPWEEPAV